jgi:hypothetical protein
MEMERLMREAGYTGNDPVAGMKHVWEKMPTDEVAETIEAVAKRQGLPTPWQQLKGKSKLGGPEPHDGPDAWYDRERPMDEGVLDNPLTGRGFAKKADGRIPNETAIEGAYDLENGSMEGYGMRGPHPAGPPLRRNGREARNSLMRRARS